MRQAEGVYVAQLAPLEVGPEALPWSRRRGISWERLAVEARGCFIVLEFSAEAIGSDGPVQQLRQTGKLVSGQPIQSLWRWRVVAGASPSGLARFNQ
jgi:hypothetical protein